MTGTHKRNIGPMRESPRCGAKTRKGTACEAPAVSGRKRCRMHGGAKGSGAPIGNKNALKHGEYSRETRELRTFIGKLLKDGKEMLDDF